MIEGMDLENVAKLGAILWDWNHVWDIVTNDVFHSC